MAYDPDNYVWMKEIVGGLRETPGVNLVIYFEREGTLQIEISDESSWQDFQHEEVQSHGLRLIDISYSKNLSSIVISYKANQRRASIERRGYL